MTKTSQKAGSALLKEQSLIISQANDIQLELLREHLQLTNEHIALFKNKKAGIFSYNESLETLYILSVLKNNIKTLINSWKNELIADLPKPSAISAKSLKITDWLYIINCLENDYTSGEVIIDNEDEKITGWWRLGKKGIFIDL